MSRPILVDRELRLRFDNDDALHAPQRRAAEQARTQLLARRELPDLPAVTWLLSPRPDDSAANASPRPAQNTAPTRGKAASRNYSNAATVQIAQTLGSPEGANPAAEKHYFADLPPELQRVLEVQLRMAGDVSAVIEMPTSFVVVIAENRTAETLEVRSLSLPKQRFDAGLSAHTDTTRTAEKQ